MVARLATGFGSTPFHKIDSVYSAILKDHFVGVAASLTAPGTLTSELPWVVTDNNDSDGDVTIKAGEADHPGIVTLATGGTTAADGDVVMMALGGNADAFILGDDGIYLAAVLRVPDVDAQKVAFGLATGLAAVNSSADDFVGFVFDPEDASNTDDELWFAQLNDATVDAEEVLSTVPYVQNDWVLLELAATDTSTTFRITTEDNEETVTIAGSPTVGLQPVFLVEAVGAAEETIDIDLFVCRYVLPNDIVNYLGA